MCSPNIATRPRTRHYVGAPPPGNHHGLTLVELLAVVVILGLLAATLTLSFRGQVSTAKHQLAKSGIAVVVNAIETFALENGRVPTMEEGLDILTRVPPGRSEPYLKPDKLLDPWRNPYIYITPGPKSTYVVMSYGADKQQGGTPGSEAADISSDDLGEQPAAGAGAGAGTGGGTGSAGGF